MSIRKRFTTLALATVLGTCLAGPAAGSQTAQLISATALGACTPNGGGTPGYSGSLLYNVSTSQVMHLDCSLPIASASVSDLAEGTLLQVTGVNASSTETLSCEFKVVSPNGFIVTTLATQSLAPGNSGVLSAAYAALHLTAPAYASCSIPKQHGSAKSGLVSSAFFYTVWPD